MMEMLRRFEEAQADGDSLDLDEDEDGEEGDELERALAGINLGAASWARVAR